MLCYTAATIAAAASRGFAIVGSARAAATAAACERRCMPSPLPGHRRCERLCQGRPDLAWPAVCSHDGPACSRGEWGHKCTSISWVALSFGGKSGGQRSTRIPFPRQSTTDPTSCCGAMKHSGAPASPRKAATAWVAIGQWRLVAGAQFGAQNTVGECVCVIRRAWRQAQKPPAVPAGAQRAGGMPTANATC